MQRDPSRQAHGYTAHTDRPKGDQPMSMLEAGVFFGVLALIVDGIGAALTRLAGYELALPMCLAYLVTLILVIAAGFVGARYTATVNGVWAGIVTYAIYGIFSPLLYLAILPEYRALLLENSAVSAEAQRAIPGGVLAFVIVLYVVFTAISTLIGGALFGLLGAAIARSSLFRPKDEYVEAY